VAAPTEAQFDALQVQEVREQRPRRPSPTIPTGVRIFSLFLPSSVRL
jgi:hypothetical protein